MKVINFLADILFRQQKKLEILAIFLICLTISFWSENSKTTWLWSDYPFIALILVVILIMIALIWTRIEKKKTNNLIQSIKEENSKNETKVDNQLNELSIRQREVFDLIVIGKSNKEIMSELSIELSTLKTHINKIYKILHIDSRKQIIKYKNTNN